MKKPCIYPDRSQELLALFEQAGNNSKVMCVPIDYAKKNHLVMFCNGYGEVLRKPFSVKNSSDGVRFLIDQVARSCRQRHIESRHVFLGGEDVNSYADNFANALRAKGCAHTSSKYRVLSWRTCRWCSFKEFQIIDALNHPEHIIDALEGKHVGTIIYKG
jgi:hypothetical protein